MGIKNIFPEEKIQSFKQLIKRSDKIVVTCHIRPDGDAIGSCLGWYFLLRALEKDVTVVVPDRPPTSLAFLPGSKDIVINTLHTAYCQRLLEEADLVLMCDFNSPSRQGDLGKNVIESPAKHVLIDHHKRPDVKCDLMFSEPEMSSTCELSFRLMAALGLYKIINLECATALLTGLITDTQNFTVNCDNPETYEIMIKLLEKGVDKKLIIDEAVKSTSYQALKLKSFAISDRLEIYEKHRCSLITLSSSDLARYNYQKGDTEGLVNIPLNIRGMVYSVFMREDEDCIKVSMRSRLNFPVDRICLELFNGGGHQMAAGGEFYGPLEECRKILIDHLNEYDKYLSPNLEKLELK